ncbi:MAG: alpha-galactosidase [Pirellulaceae bacterium]
MEVRPTVERDAEREADLEVRPTIERDVVVRGRDMGFWGSVRWLSASVMVCWASALWAATPTHDELTRMARWVDANFTPAQPVVDSTLEVQPPRKPGLIVLENHGPVLFNGRPDGRPLKIAHVEFRDGLLCHAPSRVVVRLPGPGSRFSSIVGIDAHAGGGSVRFSVEVRGQVVFQSDTIVWGPPGTPMSVDLEGADEFTLQASDAGDGIECDHANWVDAKVTLADGQELRLADLPLWTPEIRPRRRSVPPFSFVYGGKDSDQLLGNWQFTQSAEKLDLQRTRHTQTYTDPDTGLVVRCVVIEYHDFPTVEWTLSFRNTGQADTPILKDVQALDTRIGPSDRDEFLLHHHVGSPATVDDFAPLETRLGAGVSKRISAAGGRPTNSDMSYFNVECNDGGLILAVGWPGQWMAEFVRESHGVLRICAGQEQMHLKLRPNEEVRTPLIVLQCWKDGDWIRAQNIWRRWMVAHNLPRPGGKLVATHYGGCFGNLQPRAEEDLRQIDGLARKGIKLDYWFIDAGWYPCNGSWVNVGNWQVDQSRFPQGLREVAEHLHAQGIKFVLWFEPERVSAGSWLADQHPDWVLGGRNGGLLNLGNPEAWQWTVNHFDGLLRENGVDVYRQDFNMDPLTYWQANDDEDRVGITENHHVTGYLAYWDELLRRHPDLLIDTCASGGRRNDLETLRRSVPLLRSDWAVVAFTPAGAIGQQCQTYGLSLWSPYHGTGAPLSDDYTMRSSFAPAYRVGVDADNPNTDWEQLRRTVRDFRQVEKYLLGDFYPLTPYSQATDVWMAWQFDRPELGEGLVQAFRREENNEPSVSFRLRGLEADAEYTITDLDSGAVHNALGRELAETGLAVTAAESPSAILLLYRKRNW